MARKIKPENLRQGYIGWSPFADAMKDGGKEGRVVKNWDEFRSGWMPFDPDYNQIVDFFFERYVPSKKCEPCGGRGYSPGALEIESELSTRLGWIESIRKLSEKEKEILRKNGRPLEDGPLGLDSQSMNILIRYHTESKGIDYKCENCRGEGVIAVGDERLGLNLWMTHPRKGSSRGIFIEEVQDKDFPEIYALLNDAKNKLLARFKDVPSSDVKIEYKKGFPDISGAVLGMR